ncbi:MAG TPA: oxygen-independent coproporphyrinogen III oxidase, partial [Thermoanaerobaculia bacterium]|nr:oxygen-independent coproporphyrinogen III oxidase [Thermoanaerobaculia bacterium]
FDLADDCEIGVEVDPRECTPEQLDALAASGFNRISMGVQDLSAQVQAAVNRIQPPSETLAVLEGARERGMESANVDLIYGLPFQTAESFAATLEQVIDWRPDRLAVFNFAYLPEAIPHQRTIDPKAIPDGETKLRILEETIETLTKAGYIFIGMDHFALPEDPLSQALRDRSLTRNFQGYSTRGEADLLAFGVSAISQVGGGYAQNTKAIPAYEMALGQGGLPTVRGLELTPDDELRREVIMRLMCHFLLPKSDVEKAYGIEFDAYFADELEALAPFVADDLITVGAKALEITPRGRLLVRNIAMVFDAYLKADVVERYSRTV